MSRENVELWRASIDDAFFPLTNEFDPEAAISRMAELWDPEVEFDTSEAAALDIGDLYRGRGGAGQFWREWLAAWETMQFEYTMVDADDRVVMLVTCGRADARPVSRSPLGSSPGSARFGTG